MSNPVDLHVECYAWHTFNVHCHTAKNKYTQHSHWIYPPGMEAWLIKNVQGRWGWMMEDYRSPLFIEDLNDALMFKLAWGGSI